MYKYKHTFHLLDGTNIEAMAENEGICHITFGNETAFYVQTEDVCYTIPFFNVSFIETEELYGWQ